MKSFNLLTDVEYCFDENTTPEWAAAYAYCTEHNLASALFASAQDGRFPEFFATLPSTRGRQTIAVGEWAASCKPVNKS